MIMGTELEPEPEPERGAARAPDAEAYGPVGTRLLLENDRVRVWEVRLAPGERGALHHHELDHVLVHISAGRVAVESAPGSPTPYGPYLEADVEPGEVSFMRRGGIETAINVDDVPFHEILVELKDG
jgi:hypothetical protein